MQAAEKRQMESVKTLYNAVYKLRQKVADLTLKVDTQVSFPRRNAQF